MTTAARHTLMAFGNPFLRCDQCRTWVTHWHDPMQCDCGLGGWRNEPCGHNAGVTSACLSWGPVNDCECEAVFGRIDHQQPPTKGNTA